MYLLYLSETSKAPIGFDANDYPHVRVHTVYDIYFAHEFIISTRAHYQAEEADADEKAEVISETKKLSMAGRHLHSLFLSYYRSYPFCI